MISAMVRILGRHSNKELATCLKGARGNRINTYSREKEREKYAMHEIKVKSGMERGKEEKKKK